MSPIIKQQLDSRVTRKTNREPGRGFSIIQKQDRQDKTGIRGKKWLFGGVKRNMQVQ